MDFKSYVKKHGFSFLGWTIPIILSLYLFNLSFAPREPRFLVDYYRTEILNSKLISRVPIKVIKNNGEEIASDLTAVKLYFGNTGKRSIKKEHILEDIIFKIDDPEVEIIDFRVLRESRDIVGFCINPIDGSKNNIRIDFKILEYRDAAELQIIYAGNPEADFKLVSGIIEESKPIFIESTVKYVTTSILNPPRPALISPLKMFSFEK